MIHSGVPQGGNTSPLLAILALLPLFDRVKELGHKIVMYADDGIIYSDKPINLENIFNDDSIRDTGVEVNLNKSHSIKENGK
jgi:hypothetical protein